MSPPDPEMLQRQAWGQDESGGRNPNPSPWGWLGPHSCCCLPLWILVGWWV